MKQQLTAVDLFCGGGGLTEGFKQAGVDVRAALDIWGPAVETHRRNHPGTLVFQEDILQFDSGRFPKADILIGSPPCTEFSYANRGGHGDLGLGMRFVLRFLRFVHDLSPKYWIMENVPRLQQTLPSRVHLKRLGLAEDGFIEIPIRTILNAADYGVPQKRLRLISGKFPLPTPTHSENQGLGEFAGLKSWATAGDVVKALPDPLSSPRVGAQVRDPCYDLELPETQLSDHFMDTRLSRDEIGINRKTKTDHSWYGKMAFPDSLDRPARTVMATQTGISRETLVLEWRYNGRRCYRRPTVRECASFQSFPITYQFWGSTAQARYKVVGNAVPPLLASGLARALLEREGLPAPLSIKIGSGVSETPPQVTIDSLAARTRGHKYPESRRFRDHLPGSRVQGVRVDFANVVDKVEDEEGGSLVVRWEARIVAGSGKRVFSTSPSCKETLLLLSQWAAMNGMFSHLSEFVARLDGAVDSSYLDADALQSAWNGRLIRPRTTPPSLIRLLSHLVDEAFPASEFEETMVDLPRHRIEIGRQSIPVRTLAQAVAASFAAEAITRGWTKGSGPDLLKLVNSSSYIAKVRKGTLPIETES